MVNLAYRAARWKGALMRRWYRARLPQLVRRPGLWGDRLPASVYALSCDRDLPEQVASVRSLLTYAGVPDRYVIVSDGSYTPAQIQLLTNLHPCVQVIPLTDFADPALPPEVTTYAHLNPMGKKLMMILSIPIQGPTIYSDSDIFFFPGARELRDRLTAPGEHSFYLPDADPAFDRRILTGLPDREPINGGFILFRRVPDWGEAMARFLALDGPPNYFTEQTMMHLTLHRDGAQPLERDRHIMGREDEFHWRDRYAGDRTVLRHYVTPVRHKFWGNWQYLG
ncbi:hypothetical protein [Spirulina major]|uniref:hypothetical protein n=1 Tax=Spirulina major TaxID=270636 RepID=UPI0009331873|nr:hypothetical protein [Spirulina major]